MTVLFKYKPLLALLLLMVIETTFAQGWVIEDTSTQSGTASLIEINVDGVTRADGITYGVFYLSGNTEKCIGYTQWGEDIEQRIIRIYLPNDPLYSHDNRYFKFYDDTEGCELHINEVTGFNPNSANVGDTNRIVFGITAFCEHVKVTYDTEDFCAGATVLMQSSAHLSTSIEYSSSTLDISTTGQLNLGTATSGTHTISMTSPVCLSASSINVEIPTSIQSIGSNNVISEIIPQRCNEPGGIILDWSSASKQTAFPIYDEDSIKSVKSGIHKLTAKTDQNCFYTTEVKVPLEACEELSFYPSLDSGFHVDAIGETSIFNSAGKRLLKTEAPFDWDGNDDTGTAAPTGQYFIVPANQSPIPLTLIR